MAVVMNFEDAIKPFIDKGALAVYISTRGEELAFYGNESFRTVLIELVQLYFWMTNGINTEITSKLRLNLPVKVSSVPLAYIYLSIADMRALVAWKGSILVASIFPVDSTPLSVDEISHVLLQIEGSMIFESKFDKAMYLEKIKSLFLQARRNVSYGDREALIRNLIEIKDLIANLNDPSFAKYLEIINGLIVAIRNTDLSPERQLKVKRSLLSIFKSISRQFEFLP